MEENSYWRSLCHAWSAHPVLEFQQRILGVTPASPGFARIAIQPRPCGLAHAQGSVCTPRGLVAVAWRKQHGRFRLEASVPAGIPTRVTLPDGVERSFAGGQIQLEGSCP